MKISSKTHTIIYIRPLVLWFFINFIAVCACSASDKYDTYHFNSLFTFMLYSTLTILFLTSIYILKQNELVIESGTIIYRNNLTKKKQQYELIDIVDFNWNGKIETIKLRTGPQVRLNNDYFEIVFKNNKSLLITYDQYSNFSEIQSFLFDYCKINKIIHIRPLEERKRSHSRK